MDWANFYFVDLGAHCNRHNTFVKRKFLGLAFSDMFSCTVKDLLTMKDIFPDDENMPTREEVLATEYKPTPLVSEVTTYVMNNWNKGGENGDKVLTIHQIISCINEIILHSLQRSMTLMDKNSPSDI